MKKWIVLIVVISLMVIAYWFEAPQFISLEKIKLYREEIKRFVTQHPFLAPFLYILTYVTTTTLSLPVGIYLSLIGGFLFPQPFCTLYVVIGATLGAIFIFLIAKTTIGESLHAKVGPHLKQFEEGFNAHASNYLLFLRVVPLFPFWFVNIAPAFFNVSVFTYSWTTLIGLIPGAFVFTQAGRGLGSILDSPDTFSLGAILNRDVKIALITLGLLALLPILIKKTGQKSPP